MALPYTNSDQGKKVQVQEMFDAISPKYDLLNHLLSMNIDKLWRKRAIRKLKPFAPKSIVDIATGTADFAIEASKINGSKITGVDISEGMLNIGREKINKKGLNKTISLVKADSESLPFKNETFDAAIVGFGVRNFENLELGLSEILRILKPGGVFMVLEFSKPVKTPFKQLYNFYFKRVLPAIGKRISKDERAYMYLPESVSEFPDGESFITILKKVGFKNNAYFQQTFGVATIYKSQKPEKR
jgi:demethylmenaquinone methyltransferase/2-methoxy-6-polyprenyl-1,4-benzoquinol methylase